MIALLYDVHGNLPALEAVIADARVRGVTGWVVGGDVALFGPCPNETVARLRELEDARWLRGNGERWLAHPDEAPGDAVVQGAIRAGREALGDELVRELGALPESLEVAPGERAWHASPVSDVRSFLPQPTPEEEELLEGVTDQRLIFGHTHVPFRRRSGVVELVNPGSVGMPLDGDQLAAYAIRHPGGEIEHLRVAYDVQDAVSALRNRFEGAWVGVVAQRIERARMENV